MCFINRLSKADFVEKMQGLKPYTVKSDDLQENEDEVLFVLQPVVPLMKRIVPLLMVVIF